MKKCVLEISTGHIIEGKLLGAENNSSGELVFTTGMVGYAETLSDPSYYGQIIVFSYPLIGNYGIPSHNSEDLTLGVEGHKIHASGVIISKESEEQFHWRGHYNLDQWLKANNVVGITGVDTRLLTKIIRNNNGPIGRVIIDTDVPIDYFDPNEHTIIDQVSSSGPKTYGHGPYKVGLIDCGVKWNIIRKLIDKGC